MLKCKQGANVKNLDHPTEVKVPASQMDKVCPPDTLDSAGNVTIGQNSTANTTTNSTTDNDNVDVAIGGGVSMLVVLLCATIALCLLKKRQQSKEQDVPDNITGDRRIAEVKSVDRLEERSSKPVELTLGGYREEPTDPDLPSHVVLYRGEDLKEKAKSLAGDKEALEKEFASLEQFVAETIKKGTMVAQREENKPHNRYNDIGTKILHCINYLKII